MRYGLSPPSRTSSKPLTPLDRRSEPPLWLSVRVKRISRPLDSSATEQLRTLNRWEGWFCGRRDPAVHDASDRVCIGLKSDRFLNVFARPQRQGLLHFRLVLRRAED